MLMPSRSADTAIAPRMRQYEHVQRRAERSPSVSLAVNRTPPQWQAPLIGCMGAFMHGSLFGIRTNNYTLSTPPARPMRASALLAANDRFRETRTPARLVSGRAALSPTHRLHGCRAQPSPCVSSPVASSQGAATSPEQRLSAT